MRGIILAGGLGTRLRPNTLVANKHALPVYDRPMAYHIIGYLREADITNIMIITGREHCGDLIGLLGSGDDLGVNLTYRVQEKADGIAGALKLCRDWTSGNPMVVLLGDNLFQHGIKKQINTYREVVPHNQGAMIFVKEVPDPERFGVATLAGDKVINIVEKPNEPETNLAVVGLYAYDSRVFSVIDHLKPSTRGEYEITDVNKAYMEMGELYYDKIEGWWQDAGTVESMYRATVLMREMREKEQNDR